MQKKEGTVPHNWLQGGEKMTKQWIYWGLLRKKKNSHIANEPLGTIKNKKAFILGAVRKREMYKVTLYMKKMWMNRFE